MSASAVGSLQVPGPGHALRAHTHGRYAPATTLRVTFTTLSTFRTFTRRWSVRRLWECRRIASDGPAFVTAVGREWDSNPRRRRH